jgi:sulfur-carrier protein adenylyltransferase/sulfurtransferase
VPGQIGLIQAAEALKLILGMGVSLIGRFLIYDALNLDFKVFRLNKNESCPLCGKVQVITDLADRNYRQRFCPVPSKIDLDSTPISPPVLPEA